MSLTQSDFRRLLRKALGGLDSSDLTNDECDELLNMSLWAIEDQFPFESKEVLFSASLVAGQEVYNLTGISTLDALHSVVVITEEGKRKKLARMTRHEYDEIHDDATDARGFPTQYMREGNALYLEPTPGSDEADLTLELSVRETLASFLEGENEVSGLPRNWDEIVLQGAIARGHNLNQDYDLRDKANNYQVNLIRPTVTTESKEESDSRYAGLDVAWDRPD